MKKNNPDCPYQQTLLSSFVSSELTDWIFPLWAAAHRKQIRSSLLLSTFSASAGLPSADSHEPLKNKQDRRYLILTGSQLDYNVDML